MIYYSDTREITEAIEKGRLDKSHLVIGWKADEWDYDVSVIDANTSRLIYKYTAGNSPWDSQQSVAAESGVGEAQLREWARETAEEIADELDLPQNVIFEEES